MYYGPEEMIEAAGYQMFACLIAVKMLATSSDGDAPCDSWAILSELWI